MFSQLLQGHPPIEAVEVATGSGGIQCQDLTAAALSIRARSESLAVSDIAAAVWERRELVLTWTMRGTRHLHPAADLPWLLAVFGPVFGRPARREAELGIAGEGGERAQQAVREALTGGVTPTRRELKARLAQAGIDVSGQVPAYVLYRAGLAGVLCVLPDPHGEERYASLDAWIGPPSRPSRENALATLATRFLAAFGPANLRDLRAWSGLSAADAAWAWSAVEDALVDVRGPAGPAWVLRDRREALEDAAGERAPVRLVGGFDALLLGYADRSLHLAPEHARRVNAGGGLIKPVVLDDGLVVGTWRYHRGREADIVEVTPFELPSRRLTKALEEQTAAVGRFLGTQPLLELAAP